MWWTFWSNDDDITLFLGFWHSYRSTLLSIQFLNINMVSSMLVYMSQYALISCIKSPFPQFHCHPYLYADLQRMLLEQNLLPFLIPSPVSNLCVTGLQSMLECLSERWRTEEIIKTNSRQPGVREPDAVGAGPWGWTSLCWQALSGHRRTVPSPLSLIPSLRWREAFTMTAVTH